MKGIVVLIPTMLVSLMVNINRSEFSRETFWLSWERAWVILILVLRITLLRRKISCSGSSGSLLYWWLASFSWISLSPRPPPRTKRWRSDWRRTFSWPRRTWWRKWNWCTSTTSRAESAPGPARKCPNSSLLEKLIHE